MAPFNEICGQLPPSRKILDATLLGIGNFPLLCYLNSPRFNPLLHMSNTPTFWMHMMPKSAYTLNANDAKTCNDLSPLTPSAFWQIGVEQIQIPLLFTHQMGNPERCLDLLYTYLSTRYRPQKRYRVASRIFQEGGNCPPNLIKGGHFSQFLQKMGSFNSFH